MQESVPSTEAGNRKLAYWALVLGIAVVILVIIASVTGRKEVEDPAVVYARKAEAQYAAFISRFDIRRAARDILEAREAGRPDEHHVAAFAGDVARFKKEIGAAKAREFVIAEAPEDIPQLQDAHDLLAQGYGREEAAYRDFTKFLTDKKSETLRSGVEKLDEAQRTLIEGMNKITQYLRQVR